MHLLICSILNLSSIKLHHFFTVMTLAVDPADLLLTDSSQCLPDKDTPLQGEQTFVSRQRNNPLDLPDILHTIADFMDRRSILICLSVSRTWHHTFLTRIWPLLNVDMDSHKCPPVSVLHAHASLIRTLSVGNDTCRSSEGLFCPYLSSLTISQAQEPTMEALAFIYRHRGTLTFLSIDAFTTDELFKAVADCQNLEELQLHNIRLTRPNQWRIFLGTLWPRLKKIAVKGPWLVQKEGEKGLDSPSSKITRDITLGPEERLEQAGEAEEEMSTSRIQDLVINHSRTSSFEILQNHLQLIRQCPDLTRLVWFANQWGSHTSPMHLLAEAIRSGHSWKRLESLKIRSQHIAEDFLTIMEGINRLTELDISYADIKPQTWATMKVLVPRHWNTIRVLNLRGCYMLMWKGWIVQDILCSMPSLIFLDCRLPFSEHDIQRDDRPWVCLGLKDLTLALSLQNLKSQSSVVARIVGLVHLERFVCMSPEGGHQGNSPRFTLNKGLDQLKSLRLKEFGYWSTFSTDIWGKPEAQWVMKNWPELKILAGVKLNTKAKHQLRHLITT